MKPAINNEAGLVLAVLKAPEKDYNANSISKELGISPMGALKIARRLEKEGIVSFRPMGKANFFRLNMESDYARQYAVFALKWEAEHALPYVRMWIEEARKIKSASAAILFGSVLSKQKEAKDTDLFLVVSRDKFLAVKKEIASINLVNAKKLHPVFQAEEDLKANIMKKDAVVLSAIKGIAVFGEEKIVQLLGLSR